MLNWLIATARRFQLSLWICFAIIGFLLSSAGVLWLLGSASVEKARSVRSEFVERDLRELVGRFDSDERFVLEHNLDSLIAESREVSPLLLPRQYYVGLPLDQKRITPRQPPRNCFVELQPDDHAPAKQSVAADKVCAYFAENAAFGSYLFLAADIYDNSIVQLKLGDSSLTADALGVVISNNSHTATWWLTMIPPKAVNVRGRFEINAIRENPDGSREKDRRVEGWAYVQREADGVQFLRIIARIDFNEFLPEKMRGTHTEVWPPKNWNNLRLRFSRRNVDQPGGVVGLFKYKKDGRTQLSLESLADSIFDSYSELAVQKAVANGNTATITVVPTGRTQSEWGMMRDYLRVINGDLIIASSKAMRTKVLPDTNLRFRVTHPGLIIERVVWQSSIALLVVFIAGLFFAWYFYRNLLMPIITLTRRIRSLASEAGTNTDHELPYSDRKNELGTLARGFNELLAQTRRRAQRAAEEKTKRQALDERDRKEAIQMREENLKLIGHEIRSPLQALISLHGPQTTSRPYLDRIHKALEYLQGTLNAQQAISARELQLKEMDLAEFLTTVARQAHLAKIYSVDYSGPGQGVYCWVDAESIEDCIENVLKNADRFRAQGTPIHLGLELEDIYAVVTVSNEGPHIAEENLERIFEFGMTTTPQQIGSAAGSGIGLYVARQYLLLMHGDITARNIPEGVCFEIKLSLAGKKGSPRSAAEFPISK